MQPGINSRTEAGRYVLDTNALLAYLGDEPGSERVNELLEEAIEGSSALYMCVVNLGEVAYIEERERGPDHAREVLASINELPIVIVEVDRTFTFAAAHLKAICPIAYADCFAAALAQSRNAILVTGDPEFKKLKPECGVRVEWIKNNYE
jgi:predicted nucleic acid-binding protein